MSVTRFRMQSTLSPAAVVAVLTDFSLTRPQAWPTIDDEHFQVHAIGEFWADVTEGTAAAWERARYDWDDNKGVVTVSTLDSKLFGPGGGWTFTMTAAEGGSIIDIELVRQPQGFKRRLLAGLLPLAAPGNLRKSFAGPLPAA